MKDLSKLSRHERTTAEALPTIANKLIEAHKLISDARRCATDLVNIKPLRVALGDATGDVIKALDRVGNIREELVRKATS